ncbi:MAG TPA: hypothetical protein VIG62_02790 [Blastocatellia bacterium]|jgi:hypothetical protein
MSNKRARTLIAFLLFCIFVISARIEVGQTNERIDGVVEQAAARNPHSASGQLPAQERTEAGHLSALTFASYEPLLLLLLGAILFSLGTLIKFMLSKRIRDKSLPAVTSNNQTV